MEKQCLLENNNGKQSIWKYKITIEPTALIFLATATISQNLQLNLLLDKACRVYNKEGDYCESETESELIIAQINSWKLFFVHIFMVIFTSYAGPAIDRNPKKIRYILLIPILGQCACDIGNCLSVYFWNWHPSVSAVYDALLIGFSGATLGFLTICVSYLAYTSSKKERTIKIGFFYFCVCIGLGLGFLGGGYATEYLGYNKGFMLCICLHLLSLIVGIKYIRGVDIAPEKIPKDITVLGTIKQNLKVLTKKRENSKQLLIALCVFIYPLICGYVVGELSVLYLFLRHRFGWDAVEYGVFMSFKMIIKCTGALLCTEILKRRLQLHDATIGIIGCSLQVTLCISWVFVYYTWQVYAVTVMSLFEKAIIAVLMSLASKCVEPHEYGRLSALFGLTYIVTPLFYPLYNGVYEIGIYTFPSSIFLVSFSLTVPCLFAFGIMRYITGEVCEKTLQKKEAIPE